jgi:alkylation response protein AidB-like acyl-CoA dehydrogenase
MDLAFTPAQQAFRDSVREFVRERLPARISNKMRNGLRLTKADYMEWYRLLAERGWYAGPWPTAWGGQGWTVIEHAIFEYETLRGYAPPVLPFGIGMLAPVLFEFGNQAQRRHWLPRILNLTDWWCQGYSEPNAGSDLAALQTSAVRKGDHYIVRGQKIWTTLGQYADMIFCLVRTDPKAKKQEGISFLLIDMKSPGVEVRPIVLLDGEHEVNEVFLTDVAVPVDYLIGEENKGWTYAKYLLTFERANIAGTGFAVAAFNRLKEILRRTRDGNQLMCDDESFAARVARVEIDLNNLETTSLRVLAAAASGADLGPEASMLKIRGTEVRQEISSLTRRALGGFARPFMPETRDEGYEGPMIAEKNVLSAAASYFNNRKLSIYGGSNEVQRNIISKTTLRL